MAYSAVPTVATGDLWTAANHNQYIRDNFAALVAGASAIEVLLWEGGSVLTTGIKGDLEVPFSGTITKASLLADQSGNLVIDVWKDAYGNYPPTVADSICGAAKPTLSAASKSQDATLTGWTKTLTAGDILRFNIDSVGTITRATLSIWMVRSY